jgi:hypothetical protein
MSSHRTPRADPLHLTAKTLEMVRTVVDVVEERVTDLALPVRSSRSGSRYCATAARSPSPPPRSTRRPPKPAEPGTPAGGTHRRRPGSGGRGRRAPVPSGGPGLADEARSRFWPVPPRRDRRGGVDGLRRQASRGRRRLIGVQGDRVVVVIGRSEDPLAMAEALAAECGPGPVVTGPVLTGLGEASRFGPGRTRRVGRSPGLAGAPRPVTADDLLPERALNGTPGPVRIGRPGVLPAGQTPAVGDHRDLPGDGPFPGGDRRGLFVTQHRAVPTPSGANITGWDPPIPARGSSSRSRSPSAGWRAPVTTSAGDHVAFGSGTGPGGTRRTPGSTARHSSRSAVKTPTRTSDRGPRPPTTARHWRFLQEGWRSLVSAVCMITAVVRKPWGARHRLPGSGSPDSRPPATVDLPPGVRDPSRPAGQGRRG